MNDQAPLPPGQFDIHEFPRFGLSKFARRFPREPTRVTLKIGGDVARELNIGAALLASPRAHLTADFHCVTTWTARGLRWGGWRFKEVYEKLIVPLAAPDPMALLVVMRGEDGYCARLPLEYLLKDDVLLANELNEAPLGVDHGAPLRLVAPAHYGYKNCKHLTAIEFWRDARHYHFPRPYPTFMDHPLGRVALEERGRWIPAQLLRVLYRALIPFTVRSFRRALDDHERR
jgi:DMSO/TMAO reductase YedYZ molybdopterin-dependent catalytic subunit